MGMIEIETERLTLKKLGIAHKEHYLNKGGVNVDSDRFVELIK